MQPLFQSAKLEFLKTETARTIGQMADLELRIRMCMDHKAYDSEDIESQACSFKREMARYSRHMSELNREFRELRYEIQKL